MYYKADLKTIKQDLTFAIMEKQKQIEAFSFLVGALENYKRKQLNKYFSDLVAETAPKYKSCGYNDEVKEWPAFSVKRNADYRMETFLVYFSERILKDGKNEAYMLNYSETIYFDRDKETGEYKTAPEDLKVLLLARLEGLKEYKAKLESELKNINAVYNEYNKLRTELEKLTDGLSYFVTNGLDGKTQYSLINNK